MLVKPEQLQKSNFFFILGSLNLKIIARRIKKERKMEERTNHLEFNIKKRKSKRFCFSKRVRNTFQWKVDNDNLKILLF